MVKLNNQNGFGSQQANQSQSQFNQQSAQSQNNQANFNSTQAQQAPSQKGLISLPPAILQMVPWIPLMLEMTTGQKIPQMTGTIGEIQVSLQQIQANLAQIQQNQNQIWTKLESLENNTNNSFRLLATETKRSLELINSHPKPELNKDLY